MSVFPEAILALEVFLIEPWAKSGLDLRPPRRAAPLRP